MFRAYAGVALLSWVAMSGRFGEESEAVLALIPGSLNQPAGKAGAGSAPPSRAPALPGGRGCSLASARDARGARDACAQARPYHRGLFFND